MKQVLLLTILFSVSLVVRQARATEVEVEKDIEVEADANELFGSELSAQKLNENKEAQKVKTEMSVSKADKAIKDAKWQEYKAESKIGKTENEIQSLKTEQQRAKVRETMAEKEKADAARKVAVAQRELKAYRARTNREKWLAAKKARAAYMERLRLAKLQKALPQRRVASVPVRKATPVVAKRAVSHVRVAHKNSRRTSIRTAHMTFTSKSANGKRVVRTASAKNVPQVRR